MMGGKQADIYVEEREGDGRLATRPPETGGDALRSLLLAELAVVH
jgi:hypothetical protein